MSNCHFLQSVSMETVCFTVNSEISTLIGVSCHSWTDGLIYFGKLILHRLKEVITQNFNGI